MYLLLCHHLKLIEVFRMSDAKPYLPLLSIISVIGFLHLSVGPNSQSSLTVTYLVYPLFWSTNNFLILILLYFLRSQLKDDWLETIKAFVQFKTPSEYMPSFFGCQQIAPYETNFQFLHNQKRSNFSTSHPDKDCFVLIVCTLCTQFFFQRQ